MINEIENVVGPNMKMLEIPFKMSAIHEDGKIEGYGSTFGGAPDSYGDIVVAGAFLDTINRGGRNGSGVIPMLWQHDAKEPIGYWDMVTENNKGLKLSGNLVLEVQKAKEAHALAKKKVITGLSIGWDFLRGPDGKVDKESVEFDEKKNIRYLKKIDLWEISLVTFPANTRATITGTKCLETATNERDFERALRDAGLSKHQALYVSSLCSYKFEATRQEMKAANQLLVALQYANARCEEAKNITE